MKQERFPNEVFEVEQRNHTSNFLFHRLKTSTHTVSDTKVPGFRLHIAFVHIMESIEYWEGVSTRRLLATSLHELSTTLPPNADTKLIFHVYLRWIETHRLHENKYTVHWEKTLLQWSQSLGSRGYSEIEIEQQISTYKNAQLDYENRHNGRKLPSTEDIAKAFDEMIPASNGHGRSWQGTVVNQNLQNGLENEEVDGRSKNSNPFQHESRSKQYKKAEKAGNSNNSPHANHGVPQKNYICSRCHRKGKPYPRTTVENMK